MIFNDNQDVFYRFSRRCAVAAALWLMAASGGMSSALAGPGHDHGEDEMPAEASGVALPRFTAVSEKFELVGVVNGDHMTLYLDETDSTIPVAEAVLSLKVGAEEVEAEQHQAGEFEALLSSAPEAGVLPVTMRVTTPQASEVLSGELDIHEAEAGESTEIRSDQGSRWSWGLLGGVALGGFGVGLACSRRGRKYASGSQEDRDIGGAA